MAERSPLFLGLVRPPKLLGLPIMYAMVWLFGSVLLFVWVQHLVVLGIAAAKLALHLNQCSPHAARWPPACGVDLALVLTLDYFQSRGRRALVPSVTMRRYNPTLKLTDEGCLIVCVAALTLAQHQRGRPRRRIHERAGLCDVRASAAG